MLLLLLAKKDLLVFGFMGLKILLMEENASKEVGVHCWGRMLMGKGFGCLWADLILNINNAVQKKNNRSYLHGNSYGSHRPTVAQLVLTSRRFPTFI